MTKKGQVTIPKSIRDKLGLEAGKQIRFELRGNHAVFYPKVDDPMNELRRLRAEIQFDESELKALIPHSKQHWSKLK